MKLAVRQQRNGALVLRLVCIVVEMTMQFGRDSKGLQEDKK